MSTGQNPPAPNRPASSEAAIAARLAALRPGQRVAGFELLEPLDSGSPPAVWKAADESDHLMVITFGRRPPSKHPGLAAATAFDHPHALRTCGEGQSGGLAFTVAPFLVGASLRKAFARGKRFRPLYAVSVLQKLAWTLDAMHRDGVVHGRIRPENVMLQAHDNEPFLLGVPSIVADADCERCATKLCEGMYYWPPERFEELHAGAPPAPTSASDDQWALGVTMYEVLSGRKPFEGKSVDELSYAVTLTEPSLEFPADVDPQLRAVTLRCLAKSPAERFRSCSDVSTALTEFISNERHQQEAASEEERLQAALERVQAKGRREFWKLGAALVLISLFVGLIVALQLRSTERQQGSWSWLFGGSRRGTK